MDPLGKLLRLPRRRGESRTITTTKPPSPEYDEPWNCPRCGRRWPFRLAGRAYFTPHGAERQVEGCEACLYRDLIAPEIKANTVAAYGFERGRLAGMTLDSFEPLTEAERDARDAATRVAARWQAGVGRSLWLWAELVDPPQRRRFGETERVVTGCGCGKTHLAVSLAKAALDLQHTVKMVTEDELLADIKASYGDAAERSEAQIIAELAQPWLLVLDDVGTVGVKSVEWYQGIIYGVVDRRYRESTPIVMTTNLGPHDLAQRLGPRTMSRLSEMGVGLHLDGPDRRLG